MQTKDEKKCFLPKNYTTPSVAKSTLDKAKSTQKGLVEFFCVQRGVKDILMLLFRGEILV